jgi:L,D-peptidoglycan transpeptidase YkuD (ErfK/YbiS/YcfS/YnhG family)
VSVAILVSALVVPSLPAGAIGSSHEPLRASASCATTLPSQMHTLDGATQLITVSAPTRAASVAVVTSWQQVNACWVQVLGPWIGRIGVNGMRVRKHEGDGTTPIGLFGFYSTIYGNAEQPVVHYAYRELRCGDWWDEDVRSPTYNAFREVPCSDADPPFANGASEPLWLSPLAYSSFAVIGYNTSRTPGRGSAIFLHASLGRATTGCVALARPLLVSILAWLRPWDSPRVAIAPSATVATL